VAAAAEEHVLLSLAQLVMAASVRASGDLGGVSPVQLRALTALRRLGEANLVQLAEEMRITVSTTSRLVDRLVAAGWVHREPSPRNRREVLVTLTDSGRQLLRQYDERRIELLEECLRRVPAERYDRVLEALGDLAQVGRP
jgi:DNA-binding MarR family transcriptional regulator